ncbi:MAG: D-glycero-alpha-D-manno-heptose-1,7-bisphosphate 7-phosphatase [Ignavibacteria bacterium]|nr:D-glycero-alpha-D-manno-heptose-1,7-bisphosphate 7-phosphatase [Ignavibacteria bacterium]
MRKAIFLDRDGTINEEVNYLKHPGEIRIFPNTVKALHTFKSLGFLNIIITNQSGIARGFISENDLDKIHNEFRRLLIFDGKELIDFIYFSPYHPDGIIKKFACNNPDRKPGTGMIEKASEKFQLNLSESFLIGDSYTDIKCAANAGIKSILVKTGYGTRDEKICLEENLKPGYVADDLYDASEFVKKIVLKEINVI